MRAHSILGLALAHILCAGASACVEATAPQQGAEEILAAPANPIHVDTPLPLESLAEAFPDCTWTETRGAGVSLWGYNCPTAKIVADAALPGLMTVYSGEDAPGPSVLVQLFEIAEGAPIESIAAAVQAASPAPDVTLCTLEPSQTMTGWYEFVPTGALKNAYGAFLANEAEEPSMPCGALGPSEAGGRYFKMLTGSTSKVALVHMPSDVPNFDINTLTAAE